MTPILHCLRHDNERPTHRVGRDGWLSCRSSDGQHPVGQKSAGATATYRHHGFVPSRHAWSGHRLVYPAGLLTPEFRLDLSRPSPLLEPTRPALDQTHSAPRRWYHRAWSPVPARWTRIFALHHLPGPAAVDRTRVAASSGATSPDRPRLSPPLRQSERTKPAPIQILR